MAGPTAEAGAAITFTGHADAYGFRTTATNNALPLNLLIEGDAPASRADLSSLGNSQALAAGPYPGDTVASIPGAVGGVYGVPLPNYPLVASSTAGSPPDEKNVPGISLRAESTSTRSAAFATVGTGAQGATTEATVQSDPDNGVTATAQSRVEAVTLLSLVHLGRVESDAQTVLDTAGTATSKSSLRVDGIAATGLQFTLPATTPGTVSIPQPVPGLPQLPILQFPTLPVPLGGTTLSGPELSFKDGAFSVTLAGSSTAVPVPFDSVAAAFKAIGVTVSYQAAQKTDNSVVAPTLSLSYEIPAPPNSPFGVTPVTVVLGAATTSVTGAAIPDDTRSFTDIPTTARPTSSTAASTSGTSTAPPTSGTTAQLPPPPTHTSGSGVGTAPEAPSKSSPAPAVPDGSAPAVPDGSAPAVPDGSAPAVPDVAAPAVPDVAAPMISAVAPQASAAPPALASLGTKSFPHLYPLFLGVALVIFLAGRVLQLLGVRFRWTS